MSALLTNAKKTEERAWLNEVSPVPLPQSLKHLATAYKNFFDSRKGKKKGIKVGTPKIKKKTNVGRRLACKEGNRSVDQNIGVENPGL
jgi:putative transposase